MNYLWVTGMFRSGTTLLAKMFDAHPEVAFASDPYRPFFNDLRDTIANTHDLLKNNPPHMPLSDYFCDDEQLEVMKLIQETKLDEEISAEHRSDLITRLRDRGMEFSPFVAKRVEELQGKNYRELYQSMMKLVGMAYGKTGATTIGTKEVWCSEFTAPLVRSFPNLKVIHIVRDPRAVSASRNIVGEKYPWIFLARQWRKLSIFSWLFSQTKGVAQSLLVIKYEDLIQKPEETARKMCSFAGINFSSDMIDGTKFRDGDGSPWSQNSSYGGGRAISAQYSEKWREVLRPKEIRFIEMLCFYEMKLFGYKPLNEDVDSLYKEFLFNPLIVTHAEMAEWIKQYSATGLIANISEMAKERARYELLKMDADSLTRNRLDESAIEAFFVSKEYFSHMRKVIMQNDKECVCKKV